MGRWAVGALLGLIVLITVGTLAGLVAIVVGIAGGATSGILLYRQLNKNATKLIESTQFVRMLVQQKELMDGRVSQDVLDKAVLNIKHLLDEQGRLIEKTFAHDLPLITVEPPSEAIPSPPMLNPPNAENNASSHD